MAFGSDARPAYGLHHTRRRGLHHIVGAEEDGEQRPRQNHDGEEGEEVHVFDALPHAHHAGPNHHDGLKRVVEHRERERSEHDA